jgi:hypothetical protein
MITHDDLTEALYEAYRKERDNFLEAWDDLPNVQKKCWSAVAFAAWELVEGESAAWAKSAMQREEDLREIVVEFMNKAEVLIS